MMCRGMDGKFAEGEDRAIAASDAVSPALLVLGVGGRKHRSVARAVGGPVAGGPVRRQSP